MISIIVPIYKAEKFLPRCIESIIKQTYKGWELLLIDDGSPDNSGAICDEYAQKEPRIKVFHKENGGVSSARNLGIEKAVGEWVSFVDADDYISINYCEAVIGRDIDIIVVDKYIHTASGSDVMNEPIQSICASCPSEYERVLKENLTKGLFKTPWGKIIRRKALGNLRFIEGQKIGEDTVFVLELFSQCCSLEVCNGYFYYWQEGDIDDQKKYSLNVNDALLFVKRIFESYQKLNIDSSDFETLMLVYFSSLLTPLTPQVTRLWFRDTIIKKYSEKNSQHLSKWYNGWRNNPYSMYLKIKFRNLTKLYLCLIGNMMFCRIKNVMGR
ncbi:glycosyltransferase family 2 protein [Bacteroides congonensis]